MSKHSAAWLVLRVIGLLLLGEAAFLLYGGAVHLLTAGKLHEIASAGTSAAGKAESLLLRARVDAGLSLVQAIVVSVLSYYFLRRGKAVHALLVKEDA